MAAKTQAVTPPAEVDARVPLAKGKQVLLRCYHPELLADFDNAVKVLGYKDRNDWFNDYVWTLTGGKKPTRKTPKARKEAA